MSAVKFILSLARKLLARESKGITTIPNQMAVEQKAGEIAATLQGAGLPLNRADEFIKSEQDLTRVLNIIESTPPVMKEVPSGIRSTKSAKVFDMEGKEIDPRSKIMGGKQSETEAEIAERLNQENRKTVSKIKDRQRMVDDAIDNVSPGFSGDTKIDAELVAEDLAERMGLVYDDLPTKQRLDLYDQAYTGLSKQRFKGMKKPKDDPEEKAMGGRIGYKDGPDAPGRRKFMKIMGGLATIPFVGKFFKGAETVAPAVEKAAETVTEAPSYFFDLVAKIKLFGKPGISIGPRQNTMNYKNYELMEDISTGDIRITKQKGDPDFAYEEEVMDFRKGGRTEDGVIPDEYEEVTIRPDGDGKMKDVDIGIEPEGIKEIIEEVTKEAPSIKKAGGGIARMLGE